MDIFEHVAQIIVQARVNESPSEFVEEKVFRNLKLSERESVTLAFKRAGDVSKQAWKDLTVDIYYNPDPENSRGVKIEQWYLGLKGQPKVQKRQLMQLYRSIHLHLRLLPIYRAKVNSVSALPLSYHILKTRPPQPLQGASDSISIFNCQQSEGSLVMRVEYLRDTSMVMSRTLSAPIAIPVRHHTFSGMERPKLSRHNTGPPIEPSSVPANASPLADYRRRSSSISTTQRPSTASAAAAMSPPSYGGVHGSSLSSHGSPHLHVEDSRYSPSERISSITAPINIPAGQHGGAASRGSRGSYGHDGSPQSVPSSGGSFGRMGTEPGSGSHLARMRPSGLTANIAAAMGSSAAPPISSSDPTGGSSGLHRSPTWAGPFHDAQPISSGARPGYLPSGPIPIPGSNTGRYSPHWSAGTYQHGGMQGGMPEIPFEPHSLPTHFHHQMRMPGEDATTDLPFASPSPHLGDPRFGQDLPGSLGNLSLDPHIHATRLYAASPDLHANMASPRPDQLSQIGQSLQHQGPPLPGGSMQHSPPTGRHSHAAGADSSIISSIGPASSVQDNISLSEELPFALDMNEENDLNSFVQNCNAPAPLTMFASRRTDLTTSISHMEDSLQASRKELQLFSQSVKQVGQRK